MKKVVTWNNDNSSRVNFGIDYYALLGENFWGRKLGKATLYKKLQEIKDNYGKSEKRVKVEVTNFLQKKLGREPRVNEIKVIWEELVKNGHDDYWDEEAALAFMKFQISSDMKEILP